MGIVINLEKVEKREEILRRLMFNMGYTVDEAQKLKIRIDLGYSLSEIKLVLEDYIENDEHAEIIDASKNILVCCILLYDNCTNEEMDVASNREEISNFPQLKELS